MKDQEAVQVVRRVYDAFARADALVPVDLLTEDADWWASGPPAIPWAGQHRGRQQVTRYIETVRAAIEVGRVEMREFIVAGDRVVVLGHVWAKARATGRSFDADFAHVWTLRDGKVSAYRNYVDSAAVAEAFRPI